MRVPTAPSAQAASRVLGLVFFAGHGLQVSGKNYLVPSDLVPSDASGLHLAEGGRPAALCSGVLPSCERAGRARLSGGGERGGAGARRHGCTLLLASLSAPHPQQRGDLELAVLCTIVQRCTWLQRTASSRWPRCCWSAARSRRPTSKCRPTAACTAALAAAQPRSPCALAVARRRWQWLSRTT